MLFTLSVGCILYVHLMLLIFSVGCILYAYLDDGCLLIVGACVCYKLLKDGLLTGHVSLTQILNISQRKHHYLQLMPRTMIRGECSQASRYIL